MIEANQARTHRFPSSKKQATSRNQQNWEHWREYTRIRNAGMAMTQVKLIRGGQPITGEDKKTGNVKQNMTHKEKLQNKTSTPKT